MYCFFCKQKAAYELRISDWSSDVCSAHLEGTSVERAAEAVEHPAEEGLADVDDGRRAGGTCGAPGTDAGGLAVGHADEGLVAEGDGLGDERAGVGGDDHLLADGGVDAGDLEVPAQDAGELAGARRAGSGEQSGK